MFTKTTVLNYMRGTGGEFFLNLLHDTSHSRPELYEKTNRYVFPDVDLEFQIMFQSWADAIHAGFDNVDDYLFYKKFNEDIKRYDDYKLGYPGNLIYKVLNDVNTPLTLEQYCLDHMNKIEASVFPTHYKHSHKTPIKHYLPNTHVVKLTTGNIDKNYFRLLFICKFLLSHQMRKFTKTQVIDYVYEDMFFNTFCPFDASYPGEICVDAYDFYFARSFKINDLLSDITHKKVSLNFDRVKKYTADNLLMVKTYFDYDISKGMDDEQAKVLFFEFIDRVSKRY